MLPKKNRLPLKTEFQRLKRAGRLIQTQYFGLLLSQLSNQTPRFAFIISKKVEKRATKRNLAKRHLSEAIYSLLPKIKPGTEAVFLAKPALINQDFKTIKNEVEKLLT